MTSGLAVKNCSTLAEHAGHDTPDGLDHPLRKASWDTDGVCDAVRRYVVERLDATGPVFVVDETCALKKGVTPLGCSASTGTAGRIENAQVAAYLAFVGIEPKTSSLRGGTTTSHAACPPATLLTTRPHHAPLIAIN
ncbi:hypothetical protein E0H73_45495 [Kribbella pittospori]|uniref:Transposase IS701-like DDE domain-containing protein n=1 Tax=Kribbella pittospori TaxID=722689 RepID=A0A4R0JE83_9ACTN|nr:transposase [Kribbella pittospori]TCC44397.1 hypothetical protein E0H73_45495 [Kribbella pittospori]